MASENFSKDDLMEEVRKYPCLYDKICKDFKDKYVKLNSWKAVGENSDYFQMKWRKGTKIYEALLHDI